MTRDDVLAFLQRPDPPARAACDLAVALSPAAFVEPALLRAVRLDVLPHLDAETEADLWFSPLVRDRTPDGISLEPDALVELRRRLRTWLADALWQRRAVRAAELILGRDATELRRVAERVTWWSLSEADGAEARIARELAPLLDAVRSGASGHARWAVRTLPRLPAEAQRSPAVWRLAAHASSAVQRPIALEVPAPRQFQTLGIGGIPPVELPLRRIGDRLELGAFAADHALGIRIPATRPLVVEVRSDTLIGVVTLLPGAVRTVEVGHGDVRLRSVSGDVFLLPARRPLVYISHAAHPPEESPLLDAIASALAEAGFEPWIDRERLRDGEPWRESTSAAQSAAAAAVLILTRSALKSEWVLAEVNTLMHRRSREPNFAVVPVLVGIEPAELHSSRFEPSGISGLDVVIAVDEAAATAQMVVDGLAPVLDGTWHQPPEPFDALYLLGHRIMLDRAELRIAVRRLAQEGGILVVNGPPGSGKSYSRHYILHVAEVTGSFDVASVDAGPLDVVHPEELAQGLAVQMGVATDSMPAGKRMVGDTYARHLASWLFAVAEETGRSWCWVLDGLGRFTPQATESLIEGLARGIVDGSNRRVSLVLLDYPEPLPYVAEDRVHHEKIAPIGSPEVRAFVDTLEFVPTPEERDALVRRLVDGLPEGPARLAHLSLRLARLQDQKSRG